MERNYLTVFAIILVASIVLGITWNAVLDIQNHGEIRATINQTHEMCKAGKTEEYLFELRFAESYIYEDYSKPQEIVSREASAIEIFNELRSIATIDSISTIKAIDRTVALCSLEHGKDGQELLYLILIQYEGRDGDTAWIPFAIPGIRESREQYIEMLKNSIIPENAARQAEETVKTVLASRVEVTEEKIKGVFPRLEGDIIKNIQKVGMNSDANKVAGEIEQLLARFLHVELSPKGRFERLKAKLESKKDESAVDTGYYANELKGLFIDRNKLEHTRCNELAKIVRSGLQNAEGREEFALECEEAAKNPDADLGAIITKFVELSTRKKELKYKILQMLPMLISNENTGNYWESLLSAESVGQNLEEIVGGIELDSLNNSDLFEARRSALENALQLERNRRGNIDAKMRKQIEGLTASMPAKWKEVWTKGDFLDWAFASLEPTPAATGLKESRLKKLIGAQERFYDKIDGNNPRQEIVHHMYPDPESGFERTDTNRTSEIVRVRYLLNPEAEPGDEIYTNNDFMLLQEMSEDWSIQWRLYRVCFRTEHNKCREISQQELDKRKAYFPDGEAR